MNVFLEVSADRNKPKSCVSIDSAEMFLDLVRRNPSLINTDSFQNTFFPLAQLQILSRFVVSNTVENIFILMSRK